MTKYFYNNFTLKERLLFFINSVLIFSFFVFFSNNIIYPWNYYPIIFLTAICQVILTLVDYYNLKFHISTLQNIIQFIISFICLSFIVILLSLLSKIFISPSIYFFALLIILFSFLIRSIYYSFIDHFDLYEKIVIIGNQTHNSTNFAKSVILKNSHIYKLLNITEATEDLDKDNSIINNFKKNKVKKIVLALDDRRGQFPSRFLLNAKMQGIEIIDFNDLYEEVTGKIAIEKIRPSYLIFSDGFKVTLFKKIMKGLFDVVFSLILLIISLPILILTAILIKVDSEGSIIYKQRRVGRRGKEFHLYKFRSMYQDAESKSGPVWASTNDPRITRVGAIIRKLRIDEIPQAINVLRGDMSFVGPRPERPAFVNKLKSQIPYYTQRLLVKPGITGWVAVKYKYGASVEDAVEKMQYDLYYIKHLSLFLDLNIIFYTIRVVFAGKGL